MGVAGFAYRELWNVSGSSLLRLDVCRSDHLAPLLGVFSDELYEFGWRGGKRRVADQGDPRLEPKVGEARVDLPDKSRDDLRWRILRSTDAPPRGCLKAGHELGHGRNIRQGACARRTGHRERTQPAGPDVLYRRCHGGEERV